MKALVGAFNQEKALVGAFSVIVQPVGEPMDRFVALVESRNKMSPCPHLDQVDGAVVAVVPAVEQQQPHVGLGAAGGGGRHSLHHGVQQLRHPRPQLRAHRQHLVRVDLEQVEYLKK